MTDHTSLGNHNCENDHTHETCELCGRCDACENNDDAIQLHEVQEALQAVLDENPGISAETMANWVLERLYESNAVTLDRLPIAPLPNFMLEYIKDTVAASSVTWSNEETEWWVRSTLQMRAERLTPAAIYKHSFEEIESKDEIGLLSLDGLFTLVLGQMAEQETPRNQLLKSLVEQCDGHVALSEEGFNNWMARRNRPARIVPRRKAG